MPCGTRVSLFASMFQIPVFEEFNFGIPTQSHVPQHFLQNALSLSAAVTLSTELLPIDAYHCHRFC